MVVSTANCYTVFTAPNFSQIMLGCKSGNKGQAVQCGAPIANCYGMQQRIADCMTVHSNKTHAVSVVCT